MAGGGGGGDSRDLDQTPTWAVAVVCTVIVIVSLALEKVLHHVGMWLSKRNKAALYEALEKIKTELMILGFISLVLTFGQSFIAKLCIPSKVADTMLPCPLKTETGTAGDNGAQHRRLLTTEVMVQSDKRRILAAGSITSCPTGKVPLISVNGLHQLHMFIFFLAAIHVVSSVLTMTLGRAKMRSWKEWETEASSVVYENSNDPSRLRFAHETSFVREHTSIWNRITVLFYFVSFLRQFFWSVRKRDYLVLRNGFITTHLFPGSKFNFQKYIKKTLEDDFKIVVGISPILWASAVLVLLLNVHGWEELFWASLFPLVIILLVGMKLQAIISKMAIEIKERHSVVQGIPLVQLSDRHFWFGKPQLFLFLIHFSLFQNAFQITYFLWIVYDFGLNSCFHDRLDFVIARVVIGLGVQILCSYITLPLYALVSQMGSHLKRSIFDEQTTKTLMNWHQGARRKHEKDAAQASPLHEANPMENPQASPLRPTQRHKSISHVEETTGTEIQMFASSNLNNQSSAPTQQH